MRYKARDHLKAAARAEEIRARILPTYVDCYDFAMPHRRPHFTGASAPHIYDSTAITGTTTFAGRLMQDLTPPMQRWGLLRAGPLFDGPQAEKVNRALFLASTTALSALDASNCSMALHEMYQDLCVGTGAMLGEEGDDRELMRFTAVPAYELLLLAGPGGKIDWIGWPKDYEIRHVRQKWPAAKLPADWEEMLVNNPTNKVKVLQVCYWDYEAKTWVLDLVAAVRADHDLLDTKDRRVCPWILPRWNLQPGQVWGWGPLPMALPDIRTLNSVVELNLQAAALNIFPPFMVSDQAVIDRGKIALRPKAQINVRRTGSASVGRPIEPVMTGVSIDTAQVVISDLRSAINRVMLAERLPPDAGAIRSATEIVQRMKEQQVDSGAAYARLKSELVVPLFVFALDVLERKGVPGIDRRMLDIDEIGLTIQLNSPLARAQRAADVEATINWAQFTQGLMGEEARKYFDDEMPVTLSDLMGVPAGVVRDADGRAQLDQVGGMMAANQIQAQTPPLALPAPGV